MTEPALPAWFFVACAAIIAALGVALAVAKVVESVKHRRKLKRINAIPDSDPRKELLLFLAQRR